LLFHLASSPMAKTSLREVPGFAEQAKSASQGA
jgi:hypothetical protein